ncbi:MAG: GGDEF domain-containing protein [Schwartzia sp.]|nr:GGDEF domain-containing protein [Schwartzia sp. (in: firmicutes)]
MKENTYCSDVLLNFMKRVSKKFDTIGEATNVFRKELPTVLKGTNIGRMILTVAMPSPGAFLVGKPQGGPPEGAPPQRLIPCQMMQRILQQPPTVERVVLYENDIGQVGSDCITSSLSSEVGVDMEVMVYADVDHNFTDTERSYAQFLMQMVFHVIGRMQIMGLLELTRVTDAITGIPNAVGLKSFIGRVVAMHEQDGYTSVFLNFKNFKYINQRVGMQNGNIILRYFSMAMQRMLERDEEIIARLGGDNFFLLARDEHIDDIEKRLNNFMLEFDDGGNTLSIRLEVRMGIYKIGANDQVIDIMDCANTAMVQSREPDKPLHVRFRPEMRKREVGRKELSVVFPGALKNEEFVVYYQPKVKLDDRSLCGAEALVRWQRNGIVVPPEQFVPVLERDGSIHTLDFYVFERICRDQADWRSRGLEPVKISANFSRQHLMDHDCASHILRIMEKYDIPAGLVEIELTEPSGMEDFSRMRDFVGELTKNGIAVSIDDFGTGYSSLNILKNLRVNGIKLDCSFVKTIEQPRPSDHIVLKNVISLINDLGMDVIAEGVETEKQAEFLVENGCGMAQGHLFDKPLPHDLFEERLENRKE